MGLEKTELQYAFDNWKASSPFCSCESHNAPSDKVCDRERNWRIYVAIRDQGYIKPKLKKETEDEDVSSDRTSVSALLDEEPTKWN